MDLDKLAQDIKTSMAFVTNLKKENESLQTRISSLEQQNTTLKLLLKEKEQSHADLLKQKDINERNVLDKIISLQTDHRLKEEHKTLTSQHADLEARLNETLQSHERQIREIEEANEVRVREIEMESKKEREKTREERERREQEWREEVRGLKEKISEVERGRAEERTKLQLEFEEKLQNVQRTAMSTHNIDVYKRKLAAQRMEHMQETQILRQTINQLQSAGGRGGRGRKRGY